MHERKESPSTLDPRAFRNTMGRFTTGVTVVTTSVGDQVHGMTANGFMSVSLDPPLVVVSIARRAKMHEALTEAGAYGVSVLCDHQETLSGHFAGFPVEGLVPEFDWADGIPTIAGALAQVVATVTDAHPAGDHTLYVGHVTRFKVLEKANPLVFHEGRYRALMEMRPEYGEAWSGFALDPHGP
jgi:flavin reductase (DIM6/NTAB) family NADH-FMN oxidoreductase RutF